LGKGSKQRPRVIDNDTFESNWDRIFDKKKSSIDSEFGHPAYTRYPHLKNQKYKQQDLTELNGDGNRDRGRYGEDLTEE